ncbi:hypothetical protein BH09MYX1_BH09MYX1_48930 [soil metagenome]
MNDLHQDDDEEEETTLPGFPRTMAGARVLLAEDDDEMRRLVTEVLQADGREVTAVASAEEMMLALADFGADAWPNDPFDVIVTDHRMPRGTGLEVIELLRNAGDTTPILLISAFADDALRDRADELETMVMHKPFPLPAFRAAVDVLLSLRPSSRCSS